ncbi:MAG: PEP-utilizing enzyme [Candidatus Dormibacteraeota bacterium]|nr:PEP-utilizing enzyme [Candidatus Dormibacteraeota bacterium]
MSEGGVLLRGTGGAPGRATGPLFVAREGSGAAAVAGGSEAAKEAAERVALRLEELAERRRAQSPGAADVLDAQAMMLRDPALESAIDALVAGGASAEAAAAAAAEGYAKELEALDDAYMRERAADVREVGRLLAAELTGVAGSRLEGLVEPSIVVARELSPAELLSVEPQVLLGLVTELGGPTAHTAIVARELGIPAVLGAPGAVEAAERHQAAEVDGGTGEVRMLAAQVSASRGRRSTRRLLVEQAPLRLMANVGSAQAAQLAAARGAAGIGLFRTELLFLGREGPPGEERQAQEYAAACRALAPHPVVIRTLDAGSDKALAYLPVEHETNPALGRRGIRLWLAHEGLHRPQVRALLQVAAEYPNLRVMLPMIGARGEVVAARRLFEQEARRRRLRLPPLGMMVELPAAAVALDAFSGIVDFVSLGTNDLTQYALGADREVDLGPELSELNPGVLRLISGCVHSAARLGLDAGVCGEMAGTPEGAVFLAGIGATSLSMSADSLDRVLRTLTRFGIERCREASLDALAAADTAAARRALRLRSSSGSAR